MWYIILESDDGKRKSTLAQDIRNKNDAERLLMEFQLEYSGCCVYMRRRKETR